MKVHINVCLEILPNSVHSSDDLAETHYQMAHAVPIVGLRPTTEPKHFFY